MRITVWRMMAVAVLCSSWVTALFLWNAPAGAAARVQHAARPAITATPTSMPGPPTLIAPDTGITLPQPVAPNEWLFQWLARAGPCFSLLSANGPHGWKISASVQSGLNQPPYEYHYTRTAEFPLLALGQWDWHVKVQCPLAGSDSEVRIFYLVTTTLAHSTFLPIFID